MNNFKIRTSTKTDFITRKRSRTLSRQKLNDQRRNLQVDFSDEENSRPRCKKFTNFSDKENQLTEGILNGLNQLQISINKDNAKNNNYAPPSAMEQDLKIKSLTDSFDAVKMFEPLRNRTSNYEVCSSYSDGEKYKKDESEIVIHPGFEKYIKHENRRLKKKAKKRRGTELLFFFSAGTSNNQYKTYEDLTSLE